MRPHAEDVATGAGGEFADGVRRELRLVEARLQDAAKGHDRLVTEMAGHIIAAGGKRFRPMLVLLAARFGGPVPDDRLVDAAVVVELTHVASLYHDDVMDEADLRRGAPSANSRWGNLQAILVGDFLFSRASSIVAGLGTDFVAVQADTFARLVHGQIAETVGPARGEDPLAHYLQVVADKTASLIATSARFGAMVAGAPVATAAALTDFGEEIGAAFQLSDDIIDVTSDDTGKAPGTDLREGVPTLPTLLLGEAPEDRQLRDLIAGDLSDQARLAEVLGRLRAHPVIDRARDEVARRAEVARGLLRPLPDCEAREALFAMCDQVVTRTS
ncbi:polyprenyl synthetase family protein [Naumannella cuiyingiana]|uniref:Heptaprenyl diphosphate synthase n=1 Tax=Naumannella cuiyingiana TaxID=1347891 RepID=A0A7Z0IKJ4_9ACTN|nr:polyprenyl synthetase family protein [Naumannella cuiyingiana]NYI70596.1 heptaprenyl diphosphate synthase [Naumannella cuiyingiana]